MASSLTAATILTLLLGVWLTHRLALARERSKASKEAGLRFMSAFASAVADLREGKIDPYAVLSSQNGGHDAAIAAFRPFVPPRRLAAFDEASNAYRACRQKIDPGITRFYEHRATGVPLDSGGADELVKTIQALLAYAEKP